jgi:hypothetical protein
MASPVDICNIAILRVGGQLISSLTENSPAAIACNLQYDIARRDLLRSHPWNFALKMAQLAQNVDEPLFDYDYSYALPADCLRVISTSDQDEAYLYGYGGDFNGFVTISNRVDYAQADRYKIIGRNLYSDDGTVKIKYIADIADTTQFDPSFVEMLGVRIAMTIAYQVSGSVQMRKDLADEFQYLLTQAQQNNGQEGTRERIELSAWLTSRG